MELRLGLLFCLLPALAEDARAERRGRRPFLGLSAGGAPWRKEAARRESIKRIKYLNLFSSSDNNTAVYGLNQFSHLFPEEFKAIYLQSRPSTVPKYTPGQEGTEIPLPAKFDWRDKKVVTQVRNQDTATVYILFTMKGSGAYSECGGCWAFSVVGALESVHAIKGNVLEELSVQQVIDCSYNNLGCGGGSTVSALSWLNQNTALHGKKARAILTIQSYHGLDCRTEGFMTVERNKTAFGSGHFQCATVSVSIDQRSPMTAMEAFPRTQVKLVKDSEYTFKAETGLCHYFSRSHFGVSITGYEAYNFSGLEDEMMKLLLKWGPLTVIVDAISWQDYLGGIIQHHCSSGEANHAVLITGFDKTGSIPYWIVRNSWGRLWGIDGYAHIKMGSNICGIADTVSAVFA